MLLTNDAVQTVGKDYKQNSANTPKLRIQFIRAIIALFSAVFPLIIFVALTRVMSKIEKKVAKMILRQILGQLEITFSAGRAGSCWVSEQATSDCTWHYTTFKSSIP